jgi:hypothetical protein
MSDAIALSSPSGRMSRRARKAAEGRLRLALFGDGSLTAEEVAERDRERIRLRAQGCLDSARNLRDLAARGMSPRRFLREAEKLEALAREMMP